VVPVYRTAGVKRPAFQVAAEGTVMTMKEAAYFAPQVPAGRSCDSRMVLPGNCYVAVAAGRDFHMTKPMEPVPKT
jgi:hypothetical protein